MKQLNEALGERDKVLEGTVHGVFNNSRTSLHETVRGKGSTGVLGERLGVPDNIYEEAQRIYEGILDNLSKSFSSSNNAKRLGSHRILFANIKIGSGKDIITVPRVLVTFDFVEELEDTSRDSFLVDKYRTRGWERTGARGSSYTYEKAQDMPALLSLDFRCKRETTIGEVVEFLKHRQREEMGNIAHELHHVFDQTKKTGTHIKDLVEYMVHSQSYITGILSVDQIFFLLYYTERSEALVKSSELYTALKQHEISRKEFREWFEKQTMIKILRKAATISYSQIEGELIKELPEIRKRLKASGNEKWKESDNLVKALFLSGVRSHILKRYSDVLQGTLATHETTPEGMKERGKNWWKEYTSSGKELEVSSPEQTEKFFTSLCTKVNKKATETLRRLSKLYALIPEGYDLNSTNSRITVDPSLESTLKRFDWRKETNILEIRYVNKMVREDYDGTGPLLWEDEDELIPED